jgi:hypothetical protein
MPETEAMVPAFANVPPPPVLGTVAGFTAMQLGLLGCLVQKYEALVA